MKILQINTSANINSTGRIAAEIGDQIKKNGWQSFIAFGRAQRPSSSNHIKIGSKLCILIHVLSSRLLDNHGLSSTLSTKIFLRKIDNLKPDLIHIHNLHGYYINYRLLFKYLAKNDIPVVWTLHDCWSFTGHCAYFSYINCDKWKRKCQQCIQKNKYPKSYLIDNSKRNYEIKKAMFHSLNRIEVTTVSDWLKALAKQSFLHDLPITSITNGVDVDVFRPIDNIENIKLKYDLENKFIILSVATSWTNRKGISDLFELSEVLSSDEIIVLVGLSSNQMKNLPSNVLGLTRTDSKNALAELYSAADVLISTSYEETFGLTIAESFACGTPAIVYNRTATPDIVSQNTGFIVEPKEYKKILSILSEIKRRGKNYYKEACRERVLKHFNKKIQFSKYIELYKSLIG